MQKSQKDLAELLQARPSLSVQKYQNPNIIKSRFPFIYERYDEPKLKILRERYNLDKVVERGKSEFEKMVLIREWSKSRWEAGSRDFRRKDHSYLNALQLLEEVEKYGERFVCYHYTMVFLQCCLSLGWQVRSIKIAESNGYTSHSVAEVWSNQYKKWVMMDTFYNIHYLSKGIPLNVLELHRIWLNWKEMSKVFQIIKGHPRPRFKNLIDTPLLRRRYHLLNIYFHFCISMKNNFFHKNPQSGKSSILTPPKTLQWYDEMTPGRSLKADYYTNREEDLYWTLNQVHIDMALTKEENCFKVYLDTFTPNFDRYLVKMDNNKWETREARWIWKIHHGLNRLEVKTVNKFGLEGIPGIISLFQRR